MRTDRIQRLVETCPPARYHIALLGASLLLLLASSAQASVLSDAAAALPPGHYVELTNTGLTGSDLMPDDPDNSMLDWSDSGTWDPVLRKFSYVGKQAGCTSTYRNIVYDEASNSWSHGPVPLPSGCGHGYDGNAADPVTGTHYFRPYSSLTIYRRSGGGWTSVAGALPGTVTIVAGIAKSPTGLLYSEALWDVYWDDATGQQVQVSVPTEYPGWPLLGDYHSMAEYNSKHDVFWIGGGNSSRAMYRVDIVGGSPVRTRLNDAPWTFGVGEGAEKTNFTPDPVTGEFIVYRKQTGTFYGYDILSDTWRTLGSSGDGNMPPLPTGDNTTPVAAPISTHGVIMYIAHRGQNATVYLYKHAGSGPAPNQPPVLGAIGNRTVSELATLAFTATATDQDAGQALTFSLDAGAPVGATINGTTGAFGWTPTEAQGPGTFPITVRVTDSGPTPRSDSETITVTVTEVNVLPVVTNPSNRTVAELTNHAFTVAATDGDTPANTITWSLDAGAPAGATIGAGTGAFSWTPTEEQGPGTFPVIIRATDNGVPPLSGTAAITISVTEVNVAPVLGDIGNRAVQVSALLAFTATATDVDLPANILTFSLEAGAPAGATINGATGAFAWTPAATGNFPITVRVTDNGTPALFDNETITIRVTVDQVNDAPTAAADGPYTGSVGTAITLDGTGSLDPDGDALTYDWDFGDGNLASGASAVHAYATGGVYNVTLRVTDPGLLFDEDATTATISDFVAANVFCWKDPGYILPQILGTWFRMEPVSGSFDMNDVLLSSLKLTYNDVTIPSLCENGIEPDSNDNGRGEISACFRIQEIDPLFAALANGTTTVTLTLEADLITGAKAHGTSAANVVKFHWLDTGARSTVAPNPLNPRAKLSFVTLTPGSATVQVFDLNGRLVRNLMRRQYLLPGLHEVTIDGRNEHGNRLASGVYYYRVNSADGVTKGSFIVLK